MPESPERRLRLGATPRSWLPPLLSDARRSASNGSGFGISLSNMVETHAGGGRRASLRAWRREARRGAVRGHATEPLMVGPLLKRGKKLAHWKVRWLPEMGTALRWKGLLLTLVW